MSASPGAEHSGISDKEAAGDRRVLVLDDQAEIADFLSQMLELIGYKGVPETDPQRALERITDEDFDAVISDFQMPEMNGYDFYKASIATRPNIASRFLFLTGDFNDETQSVFDATGAPFLSKPFRLDDVQRALENLDS